MVVEVDTGLNSEAHSFLQHSGCPQRLQTWLIDTLHPLCRTCNQTELTVIALVLDTRTSIQNNAHLKMLFVRSSVILIFVIARQLKARFRIALA